jgi:hypothetical protein
MQGTSRSLLQICCASVLGFSLGLGALQKVIDRVTLAIPPDSAVLARLARSARLCGVNAPKAPTLTKAPGGERLLSLKETCRLQARATSAVLVDAVRGSFHSQLPDTPWLSFAQS